MKTMIEVKNVSKKYKIGVINSNTLYEDIENYINNVKVKILKRDVDKLNNNEFYALKNVSFSVAKGESVGIIGGNGAGKSTLLKLISNITSPDEGEIKTNGRIVSMLEVGTGFNPELTGRENIYLNGAILGMTNEEIESKITEIINFSECGKFIDTPVKRYSSGMFVRLAYSVSAHLNSEIIIMDEVLAVGDVQFQKKCINKMIESIKSENKTILFVSHNIEAIRKLCKRCIVLKSGKIIFDGETNKALEIYTENTNDKFIEKDFESINDLKSYPIYIKSMFLNNKIQSNYKSGEKIELNINWGSNSISGYVVLVATFLGGMVPIMSCFSDKLLIHSKSEYNSIIYIPTNGLVPGKYSLDLSVLDLQENYNSVYRQSDLLVFEISENNNLIFVDFDKKIYGNIVLEKMGVKI